MEKGNLIMVAEYATGLNKEVNFNNRKAKVAKIEITDSLTLFGEPTKHKKLTTTLGRIYSWGVEKQATEKLNSEIKLKEFLK